MSGTPDVAAPLAACRLPLAACRSPRACRAHRPDQDEREPGDSSGTDVLPFSAGDRSIRCHRPYRCARVKPWPGRRSLRGRADVRVHGMLRGRLSIGYGSAALLLLKGGMSMCGQVVRLPGGEGWLWLLRPGDVLDRRSRGPSAEHLPELQRGCRAA